MGSKRVPKQSKFARVLTFPIWVLARARDLYVQSLTGSGGHVSYGNAMGCPTPQIPSLPRSYSVSSPHKTYRTVDDELDDLIRLASSRSLNGRVGAELHRSKSSPAGGAAGPMAVSVPRARTVAFGKIDEDKSIIEFGEEDNAGLLGARSRSYAVMRTTKIA